ncbi:MAG TPA: glycosyltransferase family 39 protein [Candidatus Acidoferrum sp.]|nr:glycosyltransferase family 39 protein [Candidatus Acidoferrum sp.]
MGIWRSFSRAEKALILLFLMSLPFVHPQVRSDGAGYYAYARSLIVDHNLRFKGDWDTQGDTPYIVTGLENGHPILSYLTPKGYVPNLYSVGPAILWAPFVACTHFGIVVLNHLGANIPADGHSRPYLVTVALATALYGFVGLWLSFQMARKYFGDRWAFFATVGIWFASSLPVYMYEDPAWSHALSAFTVSFYFWYWLRTKENRTNPQWVVLGLISGLMCEVYFANGVFLLVLAIEAIGTFHRKWKRGELNSSSIGRLTGSYLLFSVSAILAFAPQLIVRQIIFGTPLALGLYGSREWDWRSPHFWEVLFSPNRGAFLWTPILIPSVLGLFFLRRRASEIATYFLAAAGCFYLLISVDPWWHGVESFGIRFFVSLTPVFVMGLAAACARFAEAWGNLQEVTRRVAVIITLLIVWNLGLVFQIRDHLLPIFGQIHWKDVVYDQFRVVPGELARAFRSYVGSFL